LIVAGLAAGAGLLSVLNRLTTIETRLNDLPTKIGSQTDAKLEHLRADLIKEFSSKAKQAADHGNVADANCLLERCRDSHFDSDGISFAN
jgi:hypothetical protein